MSSETRVFAGTARLFAALCIVLLSACGGGGGVGSQPSSPPDSGIPGGGGGGPGGGTGGGTATTGFVPNAPAAGEVLVPDSRTLRPLFNEALWQYRRFGDFFANESKLTMSARADGSFQEITLDPSLFPRRLQSRPDGSTTSSWVFRIGNGAVPISGTELTPQLRASQQIVVQDTALVEIGVDLDGDGRNDKADIAVWREVVGFENVTIPAGTAAVRALRVDDRVVVRIVPSTQAPVRFESWQSSWYREGLGLVRQVVWTDAAKANSETDFRLSAFDSGTSGYGAMVQEDGSPVLGSPVAVSDGIVGVQANGSPTTTKLDKNGRVLSSSSVSRQEELLNVLALLPTSNGLRMVSRSFATPDDSFNLDALDGSGRLVGSRLATLRMNPASAAFGVSRMTLASNRDSPVIWMAFVDSDTNLGRTQDFLVVQRIGENGVQIGSPIKINFSSSSLYGVVDVVAYASKAAVRVRQSADSTASVAHSVVEISNEGNVVLNRAFVPVPSSLSSDRVRLLADGDSRWLTWLAYGYSFDAPRPAPGAFKLAEDGSPIGVEDRPDAIQRAWVSSLPPSLLERWPFNATVADGEWWLIGLGGGSINDVPNVSTSHIVIARATPGSSTLDTAFSGQAFLRVRASEPFLESVVVLDDRIVWWVRSETGASRPLIVFRSP